MIECIWSLIANFFFFKVISSNCSSSLAHAEAIRAQALSAGIPFDESVAENHGAEGWTLAAPNGILAQEVAGLALLRARAAEVVAPEELRAVYVRPSDAELNERCRE